MCYVDAFFFYSNYTLHHNILGKHLECNHLIQNLHFSYPLFHINNNNVILMSVIPVKIKFHTEYGFDCGNFADINA